MKKEHKIDKFFQNYRFLQKKYILLKKSYLKPGEGEPTLPEHDWWLWICIDDDCGRSKSESVRGLWAGALVLKCSSSLSPMISGDESRLWSFCCNKKVLKLIQNWIFDFRKWIKHLFLTLYKKKTHSIRQNWCIISAISFPLFFLKSFGFSPFCAPILEPNLRVIQREKEENWRN